EPGRSGGGAARRDRALVPRAAREESDGAPPGQAVVQRGHRAPRGHHGARLQRARALLSDRGGDGGPECVPREAAAPLPEAAPMRPGALLLLATLAPGPLWAQSATPPALSEYAVLGVAGVTIRRESRVLSGAVGSVGGPVELRR